MHATSRRKFFQNVVEVGLGELVLLEQVADGVLAVDVLEQIPDIARNQARLARRFAQALSCLGKDRLLIHFLPNPAPC